MPPRTSSAQTVAYVVIDTCVLRKANAELKVESREHRTFVKRVALLRNIAEGALSVLISNKLITEYRAQITEPRNEFVRAFLEALTSGSAVFNWPPFTGAEKENMRRCNFPHEDKHVLRTAKGKPSTIITEEARMLAADRCIHRTFNVHIDEPQ